MEEVKILLSCFDILHDIHNEPKILNEKYLETTKFITLCLFLKFKN